MSEENVPVPSPNPAPDPSPAPPPVPPPAQPVIPPATPPAAKVVVEGTRTEREAHLERELKSRETRVAELEDENRRLKTPVPAKKAPEKQDWLKGATFFDED